MKLLFFAVLFFAMEVFSATYYCDPSHEGSNAGTQANPFQSYDSCQTNVTAGDTCLCKGTETLSSGISHTTNYGSEASGYVCFIGVNDSWEIDGTKFILDGNGAATNVISDIGGDYLCWMNFIFTGATGSNVSMATDGDDLLFVDCISDSAGSHGWDDNFTSTGCIFYRCVAKDNAGAGWDDFNGTFFIYSSAIGNGGRGIGNTSYRGDYTLIACLLHDNGDSNPNAVFASNSRIILSTIDGTDQASDFGYQSSSYGGTLIEACRFTNLTTGVDFSSRGNIIGHTYFSNNTADTVDCENLIQIYDGDSSSNTFGASADGYVNAAQDSFNLAKNSVMRRIQINIPIGR